jgi:hypothetical protein
MSDIQISPTFSQVPLDDEQKGWIERSNVLFTQMEQLLSEIPAGRLRSLAATELEKTALVVNKAISRSRD